MLYEEIWNDVCHYNVNIVLELNSGYIVIWERLERKTLKKQQKKNERKKCKIVVDITDRKKM